MLEARMAPVRFQLKLHIHQFLRSCAESLMPHPFSVKLECVAVSGCGPW